MKRLTLNIPSPVAVPQQAAVQESPDPALREARAFVDNWLKGPHIGFNANTAPVRTERVTAALALMATTPIGLELLKVLESVALQKHERLTLFPDTATLGVVPVEEANISNGVGTSSELFCNLDDVMDVVGNLTQPQFDACIMFHELVHVYHNFLGECTQIVAADGTETEDRFLYEEARTVGLGRFRDELVSENLFREQLGVERRIQYAHEEAIIADDDTVMKKFSKEYLFP